MRKFGRIAGLRLAKSKRGGKPLQDRSAGADMNGVTETFLMAAVMVGSLGAGIGLAHVALSGVFAFLLNEPARVEAVVPKSQPRKK